MIILFLEPRVPSGWLLDFFFSNRRRHTRYWRDWSSDVCSSDLPGSVCAAVPGWREALMLRDPAGTAAALIEDARVWGPLQGRCEAWVAEEICTLAEEVHKLFSSLWAGLRATAAAQRSVLALRLAGVMAVHRRILYGSENRLWDLVAEAMGEGWCRTQAAALGLGDE